MKIFNSKKHPFEKGFYAVTEGSFKGEFLVFIETKSNEYVFLSLPDLAIRRIPIDIFDNGIQNKIVNFIEKLPSKVFNIVKQQYLKLNNNNGIRTT